MKKIEVVTKGYEKKYPVIIGNNLLNKISDFVDFKWCSSVCIITDSNIPKEYINKVQEGLQGFVKENIFTFKAGEKQKSLKIVEEIYTFFADRRIDRKSLVINIGGGVTSDMGGFAAATFMRGVQFINIPTTLESMVDASVGGKTGVNLGGLKNYIGTFCQPKAVIIDIQTLKTLPTRVYLQGFAEAIKHGLVADENYFSIFGKKATDFSDEEIIEIIYGSVKIKSKIVAEDEHESGIRKILNFGHTVGHAVESLSLKSSYPLFHGEAVAIGMMAEAKISELLGMISKEEFIEIEESIKNTGLPIRYDTDYEEVSKLIVTDKKNQKGKIKWSLLTGIGKADFNIEVTESFVSKALEYVTY